ncbi:OmpA family protein [Patiriisocius sp. Uisw_017]|jgi:outer membrane protein OmpA-like peptidoglycan-associated protein|uniref:OmpA family protein n=1 Tax=Patiriisocius sp. Uisw_017 TaxID=3230968 RepID=UPI0039E80DD4
MNKIYTIFLLIAVSTSLVTAQNSKTKKADKLYDQLAYTDAAAAYQKLLKRGNGDLYVFERLANSYFFINDTKKAATYYKRVVKSKKANSESVYNYAQSLKANGKFSEYNTWMKKFAEMKPDDTRAKDFMKNPNYVPQMMDKMARYSAENMEELNSEYADFGGIMFGKDFYFASGRNEKRKKYQWNEEPFLDIYKATDVGGTIKNAVLLEGDVNTKYHESNAVVSADGKRLYFDRNDYFEGDYDKSEEGVNQINLYYAEMIAGKGWSGVVSADFNNNEYSVGHPALSPDGKTLYFVSDMPGGKGMSDIYKASIMADGTLGAPQRLGDNINTEGKELFPFVDSNGTIYFSSDGHLGIGGLDVFYAEASGSDFGGVNNMGAGVNSASDDFAYKYDVASERGYVSSNRTGGKGSDDMYIVKPVDIPCEVTINVQVVSKLTNTPIAGARVDLYDAMQNRLSSKTSDAKGNVAFKAECDKEHEVQAVLANFESSATAVASANDEKVNAIINLSPIEEIIVDDKVVLNSILFDLDKSNIKPQAAFELDKVVSIMNKYPKMEIAIASHTDFRGKDSYNVNLSERRAQSTLQYIISKDIAANRLSAKGYGETQPVVACGVNCTEEQNQKNRRSEFTITKR